MSQMLPNNQTLEKPFINDGTGEVLPYMVEREQEQPNNSYMMAARWLDGCGPLVRDWGCGFGYARKFFIKSRYEGVDAWNKMADRCVDLRLFSEPSEGILIRYVLEHNWDWEIILRNAMASFTKRMVVIITIPLNDENETLHLGNDLISIPKNKLLWILRDNLVKQETIQRPCPPPHSVESIFYLEQ